MLQLIDVPFKAVQQTIGNITLLECVYQCKNIDESKLWAFRQHFKSFSYGDCFIIDETKLTVDKTQPVIQLKMEKQV